MCPGGKLRNGKHNFPAVAGLQTELLLAQSGEQPFRTEMRPEQMGQL